MLKTIGTFFRSRDPKAQQLYGKLVAASRAPRFYAEFGVPDTVEGRYDMLVLHAVLVFCRLRGSAVERDFAQDVFDAMFADIDRGMREAGTGDLSVPKRIKALGQAFYGRAEAYDKALQSGHVDDLAAVIARNVFRLPLVDAPHAPILARHMLAILAALQSNSFDDIRQGRVRIPEL